MVLSKKLYDDEKLQLELMDKVSYEFKDSLNSIIGFSEIVKNRCKNHEQIGLISNILTSSERLLTFINNISDFSNFVSDNYQKVHRIFSIKALSYEVLSSFDSMIKKKSIDLKAELEDLKINNDYKIISQVLYSIFDHIIKIAPQNGIIFTNICKIEEGILYEIKTNSLVPFSSEKNEEISEFLENKDNLCANLDFYLVKKLLDVIDSKMFLCKDNNDFASIKLYIKNES